MKKSHLGIEYLCQIALVQGGGVPLNLIDCQTAEMLTWEAPSHRTASLWWMIVDWISCLKVRTNMSLEEESAQFPSEIIDPTEAWGEESIAKMVALPNLEIRGTGESQGSCQRETAESGPTSNLINWAAKLRILSIFRTFHGQEYGILAVQKCFPPNKQCWIQETHKDLLLWWETLHIWCKIAALFHSKRSLMPSPPSSLGTQQVFQAPL